MNSLLGHVTLSCAIALAGGDVTPCMFNVITLAGHDTAHHPTRWSTTIRQCGTSLDLHAIGHVTLLTRVVVGLAEVDMMQHVII